MKTLGHGTLLVRGCCCVFLLTGTGADVQQQVVDAGFEVSIERPAYPRGGPTVAIDEAHANFHTARK